MTQSNDTTPTYCSTCPQGVITANAIEDHERRIAALEKDLRELRDFMIESKFIRQLTLGGGLLSLITLAVTLFSLLK